MGRDQRRPQSLSQPRNHGQQGERHQSEGVVFMHALLREEDQGGNWVYFDFDKSFGRVGEQKTSWRNRVQLYVR